MIFFSTTKKPEKHEKISGHLGTVDPCHSDSLGQMLQQRSEAPASETAREHQYVPIYEFVPNIPKHCSTFNVFLHRFI